MGIRDDFNKCLRNNYDEGLRLMLKKNADYADITDPFANFKACEIIGVNYKRGILVRTLDKIKRIGNLLGRQAEVKDETIEDTLLDAMNYMNILLTALQFEKDKKCTKPAKVNIKCGERGDQLSLKVGGIEELRVLKDKISVPDTRKTSHQSCSSKDDNVDIISGLQTKYFNLKPKGCNEYAIASRVAMVAYADTIRQINPDLAKDLERWVDKERKATIYPSFMR